MNKVYRVIFNHVTQTWVAVAEYARAKGKSAGGAVVKTAAAFAPAKLFRFTLIASVC